MNKTIGILTHNYPKTSADRKDAGNFVHQFTKELNKKRKSAVFCQAPNKRKTRIEGIKIYWYKWYLKKKLGNTNLLNPLELVALIVSLGNGILETRSFIKENKVDLVLSMWAWPSGLYAYCLKKMHGTRYAVWALGSDIYIYGDKPVFKNLLKVILQNADYLFADGIELKQKVTKIANKECIFLPSASNLETQKNKIKKYSSLRKQGKTNIAFLGRMEKVKGPDILVDALIKLEKKISSYNLIFMGDGSLLNELQDKVHEHNLNKYVTFYGNINDPGFIKNALHSCDWLVIPSRSDSIPLVFSEAMKSSTPVIVSDLPDLKYLVNKYKVGLSFKNKSSQALYRLLLKLPKNKTQKYTKNTKNAAKEFTIQSSVKKFLNSIET